MAEKKVEWDFCWHDNRRHCIHGPQRAKQCLDADYGLDYCQEAIKRWPNVAKQIQQRPPAGRVPCVYLGATIGARKLYGWNGDIRRE